MSDENVIIGQVEQELIDRLNAALTALQQAQNVFVNTITKLEEHNIEQDSHLDIRQKILELQIGTGFITTEDADELINTKITQHNSNESSHTDIRDILTELRNAIDALDVRLRAVEPSEDDQNLTELERRLKLIDDYYDPTLNALLQAWQVAAMQGLPTADEIADAYQSLLTEKAEARANVLREFQYE